MFTWNSTTRNLNFPQIQSFARQPLDVIGKPYRSYVAIGDSLSEGLGDFTFDSSREQNGWTDRLAALISRETGDQGYDFHYANLAIRGANLEKVMTQQAPAALALQPDLITVMAGSNDLLTRVEKLQQLREKFREGILQLVASGADVVVANTINPLHLRIFAPLRDRAERVTDLVESVAQEFGLPVIDVYRIQSFRDLCFWADDMVHFSGHGHARVANQAAELLNLNYRFEELEADQMSAPARGLADTVEWLARDVIPFFNRRLKGVTSGDGMSPKWPTLVPYAPTVDHWNLVRVSNVGLPAFASFNDSIADELDWQR